MTAPLVALVATTAVQTVVGYGYYTVVVTRVSITTVRQQCDILDKCYGAHLTSLDPGVSVGIPSTMGLGTGRLSLNVGVVRAWPSSHALM